jgi:rhodanese-related sulfurtransferase
MILFLINLFKSFFQNYTKLSLKEVNSKLKNNYFDIIIDVRSEEEYDKGHYKNAINIPYKNINSNININTNSIILVYCRSGRRALKAIKKLQELNYENLYYIDFLYTKLI